MSGRILASEEAQEIWKHMRVPTFAFVALVGFLVCIVLLGALVPSSVASYLEAGLTIGMVATVLLFSMEAREEPPLMRFYALLSFCWLAILCTITMIDYWTR